MNAATERPGATPRLRAADPAGRRLAATLLLLLLPLPLHAHADRPPEPHDLWTAWSLEPAVLVGLALAAWVYARGVRSLRARAGRGRGIRLWQVRGYAAGWATLLVALVSPLDPLGEALFSAHMVQHLLLVLVAAPLLVLGRPLLAGLWALPPAARRWVARRWRGAPRVRAVAASLTHPAPAWLASAVVLWAWHLPFYYDLAVGDDAVHALEHASFLATALLFWWALASPGGVLRRRAQGLGVIYLFTHALQGAFLGAILTLSPRTLYRAHEASTGAWGLTPLEDQQLAGVVMWVPASVVYLAAICVVLLLWLRSAETAARQREAGPLAAPGG